MTLGSLKLLFPVYLVLAVAFSNCDKAKDPAPASLDNIEAMFGTTWKFKSMTLSQDSITATTSNCAKTQLVEAGFKNNYWQLADEQNITFLSATTASYYNICTSKTYEFNVATSENEDGTVNVFFSDPKGGYAEQRFVIDTADITATQFRAFLINAYAYEVTYIFTRE